MPSGYVRSLGGKDGYGTIKLNGVEVVPTSPDGVGTFEYDILAGEGNVTGPSPTVVNQLALWDDITGTALNNDAPIGYDATWGLTQDFATGTVFSAQGADGWATVGIGPSGQGRLETQDGGGAKVVIQGNQYESDGDINVDGTIHADGLISTDTDVLAVLSIGTQGVGGGPDNRWELSAGASGETIKGERWAMPNGIPASGDFLKITTVTPSGDKYLLNLEWASSGDVVGPASATDGGFAKFDGTTGKLLKNSPAIIAAGDLPYTFGDALTLTGNDIDVNVDGTTIEVSSDALRVKDAGITSAKLAANQSPQYATRTVTVSTNDTATSADHTIFLSDNAFFGGPWTADAYTPTGLAGKRLSYILTAFVGVPYQIRDHSGNVLATLSAAGASVTITTNGTNWFVN